MSEDDVRQLLLMQKRLYILSKDAIDKARFTSNAATRGFLERVSTVSRELYFEAGKLLDGRDWPSREARRKGKKK